MVSVEVKHYVYFIYERKEEQMHKIEIKYQQTTHTHTHTHAHAHTHTHTHTPQPKETTDLLHIDAEVVEHLAGVLEALEVVLVVSAANLDELALGRRLLAQRQEVRDGHQPLLRLQDGPHLLGRRRQLHLLGQGGRGAGET